MLGNDAKIRRNGKLYVIRDVIHQRSTGGAGGFAEITEWTGILHLPAYCTIEFPALLSYSLY